MKKIISFALMLVLVLSLASVMAVGAGAKTLLEEITDYDNTKMFSSAKAYSGNTLMINNEVTLNENSMPTKIEHYELNDAGEMELEYFWTYEYDGNVVTRTEYVGSAATLKEKEVWTCSDKQLVLKEEYYRPNDSKELKLEYVHEFTYDDNGNMISRTYTSYNKDTGVAYSTIVYTYTYDSSNRLTEELLTRSASTSYTVYDDKTVYTYDAQGRLILEEEFEKSHEGTAGWFKTEETETTYDADGKATAIDYDWDTSKNARKADPDGKRETTYVTIGSKTCKSTVVDYNWNSKESKWVFNFSDTYTYDSEGNILKAEYVEDEEDDHTFEVYTYPEVKKEEEEKPVESKAMSDEEFHEIVVGDTTEKSPVLLIVIIALAVLIAAYFCGYFFLFAKGKAKGKFFETIYSWLGKLLTKKN